MAIETIYRFMCDQKGCTHTIVGTLQEVHDARWKFDSFNQECACPEHYALWRGYKLVNDGTPSTTTLTQYHCDFPDCNQQFDGIMKDASKLGWIFLWHQHILDCYCPVHAPLTDEYIDRGSWYPAVSRMVWHQETASASTEQKN